MNKEFDHVTSIVVPDSATILAVSMVAVFAVMAIITFKRKRINFPKVAVVAHSERESPEGSSMDNLSSEMTNTSKQKTKSPLRLLPEIICKPNKEILMVKRLLVTERVGGNGSNGFAVEDRHSGGRWEKVVEGAESESIGESCQTQEELSK
nr:hypothetical protein HmN_000757000 [Hymenolepis microstoma]